MSFHFFTLKCNSKKLLNKRCCFLLGAILFTTTNLQALQQPRDEKLNCIFDQASYSKAILATQNTDQFKLLKRQIRGNSENQKIVYLGDAVDKPTLWQNRCHQSVSVYVDKADRVELRLVYLVNLNQRKILLQKPNGDYQVLKPIQPKSK
jgi:hypothetical protein